MPLPPTLNKKFNLNPTHAHFKTSTFPTLKIKSQPIDINRFNKSITLSIIILINYHPYYS